MQSYLSRHSERYRKKSVICQEQRPWFTWAVFSTALFFAHFISVFPIKDGGYSAQRLVLCIFLVFYTCTGIYRSWCVREGGSRSWPDVMVLFFAISGFVITPVFYSAQFKWVEPVMFSLYFSSVILGASNYIKRSSIVCVVSGFSAITVVFAFFYGGMTLNYYSFALVDRSFDIEGLLPWGFINMRYWSHMATWLLPLFPLALITVSFRSVLSWRLLVYFAGSLWVWLIIMSTARGSFLGLLVGVSVAMLLFGKSARPWLRAYLTLWLVGLLMWFLLSILLPSLVFGELEIRSVRSGDSGRIPLWGEALSMSLDRFPWGMGPQSWITHDIITSAYHDSRRYGHPHNMYLMWAAEYGWVSILGLAILGWLGGRRLLLRRNALSNHHEDDEKSVLVALTVSVVAGIFHAGVSAVFMAPASMLVGLFILMAFWGALQPNGRGAACPVAVRPVQFICVLTLLTVCAISNDQAYYYEHVPLGLLPRFWHHGNFPRHPELMP